MEKLDKFYEKVNGSYFGIIGYIISAISVIIAQMLYMESDPSFSMSTNFISDLGTGPNGSNFVFNIGMIITGFFFMLFYVYIGLYLQKINDNVKSLKVGITAGIIGSIGMILVGIFPLNPNDRFSYNMHIIAAGILFYGVLIMLLIYGTYESRNQEIPKLLSIIGFITAGLYGAFMTAVIIQYLASVPFQAYTYIIEWIGSYSAGLWIITHVYYILKHK
ncbi:MAG: DUF998 domain-containing protein [Promethearchaeota archaeon]